MLICIDAGHGLHTPGKRCLKSLDPRETREWRLNARVADKLLVYGPQSHLYVEGANAAGLSDAREYPDRPALTQAVREAVRPGDIVWFKGSLLMNLEEVLRAVFPDAE